MPEFVSSSGSETLREFVLAGPGAGIDVAAVAGSGPLSVLASPDAVDAAVASAVQGARRRGPLGAAVTTVIVLGLCLYCPEGYSAVLGRLWPLLSAFDPALVMSGQVSAPALSQARARLPAAALHAVFQGGARISGVESACGQRMFGLLLTAVDGTVFDLSATDAIKEEFAVPSGGRFPKVRVVTLVACGTRRVLEGRPGLLRPQRAGPVGPPGRRPATGHPEPRG